MNTYLKNWLKITGGPQGRDKEMCSISYIDIIDNAQRINPEIARHSFLKAVPHKRTSEAAFLDAAKTYGAQAPIFKKFVGNFNVKMPSLLFGMFLTCNSPKNDSGEYLGYTNVKNSSDFREVSFENIFDGASKALDTTLFMADNYIRFSFEYDEALFLDLSTHEIVFFSEDVETVDIAWDSRNDIETKNIRARNKQRVQKHGEVIASDFTSFIRNLRAI